MKKILLFFIALPSFTFSQGEYNAQIGFYGVVESPIRSNMPKMSTNFGIGLQGSYRPMPNFPMFIELKGHLGNYSSQTSEETYLFEDGSQTVTDVTFSSNMHALQLGAKFYYTNYYSIFRGYVTPQIGFHSMRSRIRIADPMDEDDCAPLENRIAFKNTGLTYGGELGVDIDVKRLITQNESDQRLYFSVSYLGSFKDMDYINIKHMEEHEHGVQHSEPATEGDRDLTSQFVNVSNNDLHEHKIAEIYSTKLSFIAFNLGYIWYF